MPAIDAVPLVEREAELSALAAAVERAVGGEGRLVVVEGPAGIGKTRLLRAVRAEVAARDGARVLRSVLVPCAFCPSSSAIEASAAASAIRPRRQLTSACIEPAAVRTTTDPRRRASASSRPESAISGPTTRS